MFNKLKDVKDLRSQAKTMKSALAQEKVTVSKKGVTVVMTGNMEIESIQINPDLEQPKIEAGVKEAVNEAMQKTQKLMAQKMQEMGGFPGMG